MTNRAIRQAVKVSIKMVRRSKPFLLDTARHTNCPNSVVSLAGFNLSVLGGEVWLGHNSTRD